MLKKYYLFFKNVLPFLSLVLSSVIMYNGRNSSKTEISLANKDR